MANRRRDLELEARWREALQRQRGSRLSVRAFCRSEGHSESSFHFWRRTIRERDAAHSSSARQIIAPQPVVSRGDAPASASRSDSAGSSNPPAFVPIRLETVTSRGPGESSPVAVDLRDGDAAIVLELRGGRRLRLPGSIATNRLAALVHAIEAETHP